MAISVLWVIYDIGLLSSFLWLGILDLRFGEAAVGRPGRVRLESNGSRRSGARILNLPTGVAAAGRRLGSAVLMPFASLSQPVRRGLAVSGAVVVACSCAAGVLAFHDMLARAAPVANGLWLVYELVLLTSLLWILTSRPRFAVAAVQPRRIVQVVLERTGSGRLAGSSLALVRFVVRNRPQQHRPAAPFSPTRRAVRPALGVALVLVVAAGVIPRFTSGPAPDHVRLAPSRQAGQGPQLGLSLPHDVLATRPDALQARLCLSFAVIGRTQDIDDSFDLKWANKLSAQHQQPWISLQFGNFTADGRVPLNASLPAIMNGVQDTKIKRWAEEMRSYGKPVFLTILLHVDRNWSLSSAVANGGIPQDAPRAWQHVQSIFKSVGDTNVAWVWSPADPAHDQAYAPPESTIDVVLQSMIRYPNTPWPDPATVLRSVSERHPAKPLFLEVSADGSPTEKADWLGKVSSAVSADRRVHTLLYHEGAPGVHATSADNARWSVESDGSSLEAMLGWRELTGPGKARCQPPALARPQVRRQ